MKNINKTIISKQIELTAAFLDLYFPDAYACCLTGSIVDNNFNKESDIDLWIITATRDYFFTETFLYKRQKIQIAHFPLEKITEIVWMDYINRRGLYLAAFAKGIIISDNNDFLKNLMMRCGVLFNDGPQKLTPYDHYKKKIKVIEGVSDFKGATDVDERCVIINELLTNFISLYNTQNQIWDFSGKHAIRALKRSNPVLGQKLMSALKTFYIDFNDKAFLKIVANYIRLIGDHEHGYSSHIGALSVKSDYLVMQFYNHKDSYSFIKSKYDSIYKILIQKAERITFFEARPIGDAFNSTHSVYITVFFNSEDDYTRDTARFFINGLKAVIKEKITYAFPVNIDWGLLIGAQELIAPASIFFSKLSSWTIANVNNQSQALTAALALLKDIYSVFFEDDLTFIDFLNYLYNNWIVKSYDNGKVYGFEQIVIAKKDMEELFVQQYNIQKKQIRQVYDALDFTFDFLTDFKLGTPANAQKHKLFFESSFCLTNSPRAFEWQILKNLLDLGLGTFLIPDEKKAYIPFLVKNILSETPINSISVN